MELIENGWNGEEKLWKMVWLYGAGLFVVGQAICASIRIFTDFNIDSTGSIVGKCFRYGEMVYWFWLAVSLWRCAYNIRWIGWGYLTRLIVVLFAIALGYLSYMQQRVLLPEEVVAAYNPRMLNVRVLTLVAHKVRHNAYQWLRLPDNSAPVPTPESDDQPQPKKKPGFMIKVNRM